MAGVLFANLTDLAWVFDCQLRSVYANAPVLALIGQPWERVARRTCGVLGLPDAVSRDFETELRNVVAHGKSVRREIVFTDRDGEWTSYEWNFSPMTLPGGPVVGVTAIGRVVATRRSAEQAAEIQQRGYRELVNSLQGAIYTCDREGRIMLFNDAAVALWGRTPVVGWDMWCGSHRILRPDGSVLPLDQCPMALTLKEGRAVRGFEIVVECPDGTRRNVLPHPSPLHDGAGNLIGAINLLVDITERKHADAVAAQLAAIVASSHDAIIGKNLQGIITSWNAGAEAIFGYTAAEAIGHSVTMLIPDGRRDEEPGIIERIRRGEMVDHYETIRQGKDGRLLDISLTVSPIRDDRGVVIGASKIARDITLRKQAEEEIARARDEAQAALRAKDDFLAALSHELRTPLNPVLLLASDGARDESLPEDLRADFEIIRKNVELEARLIDDLLDLTRISRGKLALERRRLDLHEMVRGALAIVQDEAKRKRIRMVCDFSAPRSGVFGDPARLQQIFWNVLKNAVKFSPEGSCVTICTRTNEERDEIEIAIADSGMGLTKSELAGLFRSFSQGEHAASGGAHRFGGLGLGLAIARLLTGMHGGRIRAESPGRDRGAVFTVDFPLDAPGASGRPDAGAEALTITAGGFKTSVISGAALGQILIVDDHDPTRRTLAHLLARRSYRVVTAGTAAEARLMAGRMEFDLVISDIGLPDGDGYELMTGLRAAYPHLRAIALSGYGTNEDIARSRRSGFDDHLIKPIDIRQLERSVAALLLPV